MAIVYWNKRYVDEKDALIPFDDRGFLFGDGVFTTMKVNQGRLENFQLHLERLKKHCSILHIIPPEFSQRDLIELVRLNESLEGVWRLKIVATGGRTEGLKLIPRECGQLLMFIKPYEQPAADVCRLALLSSPIAHPFAQVKSLSYLERLWIADYAAQAGCDDAMVVDAEGYILETSFSNIFWRIGSSLYTPDAHLQLLSGVTLINVEHAVKELGLDMFHVKMRSIPGEAQIFICNSMRGVCPVTQLGGQAYARDPLFEVQLQRAYQEQVAAGSINCRLS